MEFSEYFPEDKSKDSLYMECAALVSGLEKSIASHRIISSHCTEEVILLSLCHHSHVRSIDHFIRASISTPTPCRF
ncbi:hypothetical protein QL285_024252 [Trifolium repens]|nr:hypothetical protein QL285_024252 [Trifolium repens]